MRSLFATTLLLCGLTLSCQTGPSQTEKDLLAELQSLRAERESLDYLGKIKNAVEAWRKAMNAALAKYSEELAATRLESQQQITTMAGSLDGMARALIARKEAQDRFLNEAEKDRVQARKTLEEFKLEREASKIERDAIKLERDKVTALLEVAQRARDEDARQRREDAASRKELSAQMGKLAEASTQRSELLLTGVDKNRSGLQSLDLAIVAVMKKLGDLEKSAADPEAAAHVLGQIERLGKALAAEQKEAALARERGRKDQQGLELRMDALAKVTEQSFARLEKQLDQDRQEREREAAARRAAVKKAEVPVTQKTALPRSEDRDPSKLLGGAEPFWQNPFIAIPSAFLLLVLLFVLLRRSPEEVGMDRREEPQMRERDALESIADSPSMPAGSERAKAPVPEPLSAMVPTAARMEGRMPSPRPEASEPASPGRAVGHAVSASQGGRKVDSASMPRPRCVSLRIPGDELTEGAEELLRDRLSRDPRILVEPRPRLERRGDGSLSARFYSVGGLAETEVEALSRSLRSLVANR